MTAFRDRRNLRGRGSLPQAGILRTQTAVADRNTARGYLRRSGEGRAVSAIDRNVIVAGPIAPPAVIATAIAAIATTAARRESGNIP